MRIQFFHFKVAGGFFYIDPSAPNLLPLYAVSAQLLPDEMLQLRL